MAEPRPTMIGDIPIEFMDNPKPHISSHGLFLPKQNYATSSLLRDDQVLVVEYGKFSPHRLIYCGLDLCGQPYALRTVAEAGQIWQKNKSLSELEAALKPLRIIALEEEFGEIARRHAGIWILQLPVGLDDIRRASLLARTYWYEYCYLKSDGGHDLFWTDQRFIGQLSTIICGSNLNRSDYGLGSLTGQFGTGSVELPNCCYLERANHLVEK